jgi:methionyl-tRNA synthetase
MREFEADFNRIRDQQGADHHRARFVPAGRGTYVCPYCGTPQEIEERGSNCRACTAPLQPPAPAVFEVETNEAELFWYVDDFDSTMTYRLKDRYGQSYVKVPLIDAVLRSHDDAIRFLAQEFGIPATAMDRLFKFARRG